MHQLRAGASTKETRADGSCGSEGRASGGEDAVDCTGEEEREVVGRAVGLDEVRCSE